MVIKVNTTGNIQDAKKTKKSTNTSGVSFADMLQSATAPTATQTQNAVSAVAPRVFNYDAGGGVPTQAKERGQYLLDKLEQLEQAILGMEPTQALEHLREALSNSAIDRDQLTPQAAHLLDTIDTRAAVELAKIEADQESNSKN